MWRKKIFAEPLKILLPAPRKALLFRSWEQNLHSNSAPPPATGGLSRGAICSPPLAKPLGTVSGSKIFTAIPRRRLPPAAFPAARFAPRPSQSLWAPSRGAKSSQRIRAASHQYNPKMKRIDDECPVRELSSSISASFPKMLRIRGSAPLDLSGQSRYSRVFRLDAHNFFQKYY